MKKKILQIIIINFIVIFSFSENKVDESVIYNALKTHVEDLKNKKEYKAAIEVLEGFTKLHPSSKYLPYIFLEKGIIMLDKMNILKEGYIYIEKADSFNLIHLKKDIDNMKEKYGVFITKERIYELIFYIEKYFYSEQKFPQTLKDLAIYFKSTDNLKVKDGFGNEFNYSIKDNGLLKDEDFLYFDIFSSGRDMVINTKDDIYYSFSETEKIDIKFISASKQDKRWLADIEYFDDKHKVFIKKNFKEGDLIKDYIIFGIRENGIIVTKDKEYYVFKNE